MSGRVMQQCSSFFFTHMHLLCMCREARCSVLQYVAVCCSVLQCFSLAYTPGVHVCESEFRYVRACVCMYVHVLLSCHGYDATHCNTLQHTATHCNTLRNTATNWNTLQHTATHYNTLQHIHIHNFCKCGVCM